MSIEAPGKKGCSKAARAIGFFGMKARDKGVWTHCAESREDEVEVFIGRYWIELADEAGISGQSIYIEVRATYRVASGTLTLANGRSPELYQQDLACKTLLFLYLDHSPSTRLIRLIPLIPYPFL